MPSPLARALPHHTGHRWRFSSAQARAAASQTEDMISEAEKFILSVSADDLSAPPAATLELQGQLLALQEEVRQGGSHRLYSTAHF